MKEKDFNFSIEDIIEIAEKAWEKIMEIYQTDDFGVEQKDDESPLTKADIASNSVIVEGLQKLDINIPIMSEETTEVPYEQRKDWEYFRCVDPLDGTKEFVKRNGEFTVNIALIKNSKPIWWVTGVPAQWNVYFAQHDIWAFKKTNKWIQPIQVKQKIQSPLDLVMSRSHSGEKEQAFSNWVIKLGYDINKKPVWSALKLCIIAEGKADIYPRLKPSMEWDIASAQCILEVAWGYLQTINKESLDYNKKNLRNTTFVATSSVKLYKLIESLC